MPVEKEPWIKVGLMTGARSARLTLAGQFATATGEAIPEGNYTISLVENRVALDGAAHVEGDALTLSPVNFDACHFTVHDIIIGINFHWERKQSQSFRGALAIARDESGLTIINNLPLESYLVSVISSEMSASCPPELLRAHAIVSRSWLLAQLISAGRADAIQGQPSERDASISPAEQADYSEGEVIKWYGRENHDAFDVCADDHCQRYQGITRAFSAAAYEAAGDTSGKVLSYGEEICDTRYSKSCGGMTEVYSAAWEDKDVPYLAAVYDGPGTLTEFALPLEDELNAERWITSSPRAYCNATSVDLLGRILPGFDQETTDFYRWQVSYSQEELLDILRSRLGVDFGRVLALEPLLRGKSGRIIKLRISGEKRSLTLGKELEIRRALSRSHLYSSAFVVRAEAEAGLPYPARFMLTGAGWGHGVGLCQIGAAVMADLGHSHEEILAHYFPNTSIRGLY